MSRIGGKGQRGAHGVLENNFTALSGPTDAPSQGDHAKISAVCTRSSNCFCCQRSATGHHQHRAGLGTHGSTEVPRDSAPRSSPWNQPLSQRNARGQGLLRRRQASGQHSAQEAVRLGDGWCELEQSASLCLRPARDSQAMVPGECGWGLRGCTGLGSLAPGPRLAAPFCLCSLAISVFPVRCP